MKRIAFLSTFIWIAACSGPAEGDNVNQEKQESETEVETIRTKESASVQLLMKKDGLSLYEATEEGEYTSAGIELLHPLENYKKGSTQFEFEVSNYKLREQTAGNQAKQLANSSEGQHIHFIHNNAPYQAKYEPRFEAELVEGNNVILAFLSKSFHKSIKTKTAFICKNFYVGEGEGDFDRNSQHLFYSRPKGEYSIDKAKQLLVDFYLVNTELSEEGNKVRLTVDDTEFLLSKWQAYLIEGLSVGKHQFRIQLVNNVGELIEGPFNDSGIREIVILE